MGFIRKRVIVAVAGNQPVIYGNKKLDEIEIDTEFMHSTVYFYLCHYENIPTPISTFTYLFVQPTR